MAKLNWSKVRQACYSWGRPGDPGPSRAVRKALTDPDNPKSHYNKITGNRKALRLLAKFSERVLESWDHDAGKKAIVLDGPASSGKTWTLTHHAMVLGLPFAEIAPEFPDADKLFDMIRVELERQGLPLTKQELDHDQPYDYVLPPCVVFIDEAHQIKVPLQKGVLLKAIEDGDRTLILKTGTKICTAKVHWAIGTTDFFSLFDALRSRFSRIKLVSHTKAELAEMIGKANKDLDAEVCRRVAFYCRLPRETKKFVETLRDYQSSEPERAWDALVEEVARDMDIDEGGLYDTQVATLRVLTKGPVGQDSLASLTGLRLDELTKDVLPGMLINTVDMPALVMKTPRGYVLTEAGRAALNERRIAA